MKRKRAYGTGGLFKKGNLWYSRFRLNGKRITVQVRDPETGKLPSGKMEAAEMAANIKNTISRDKNYFVFQKKKDFGLSDAIDSYLQNLEDGLSNKWYYQVDRFLKNRVIDFFGKDIPVKEIRSKEILDFRTHLKKKMDNKTVNKMLSIVSKFLKYCAVIGEIDSLPHIDRLPEQQKETGRRLTEDEVERLLVASERIGLNAYRFVLLGLFAGLRYKEALNVCWENLDFENKLIRLPAQKNRTSNPAPLLGPLRNHLESIPENERAGLLISINGHSYTNFRAVWNKVKDSAGIDQSTRFHDLRHSFSSNMFSQFGFEAKSLTRHKNTAAFQGYLHFQTLDLIKKADQLLDPKGEDDKVVDLAARMPLKAEN